MYFWLKVIWNSNSASRPDDYRALRLITSPLFYCKGLEREKVWVLDKDLKVLQFECSVKNSTTKRMSNNERDGIEVPAT